MSDISGLAKYAYAHGQDPVDYAEDLIAILIRVHATVAADRLDNPASWPGYDIPEGIEPLARRILGELLDAGWTIPAGAGAS